MKLLGIVLAAVGTRLFTLWVTRPSFSGWLNHSHYYFVQVRGLIERGSLPYPDMPLLFYIDAAVARVFMVFGMSTNDAVVASTRLVMCIVPALIPVCAYGIARFLQPARSLRGTQWALVALAGFLPLTLQYMPDYLQKNTLGLLLLAGLMFQTQQLLAAVTPAGVGVMSLLLLTIALTHFGTFAAATLFGIALIAAIVVVRGIDRGLILVAGIWFGCVAAAVALIYILDPQRFLRVGVYLQDSVASSLVGSLIAGGEPLSQVLGSLAAIGGFYVFMAFAYVLFKRSGARLELHRRIFWLANIVFCCLLVLPLFEAQLMGRLALFVYVPLLVLTLHIERFVLRRTAARRILVGGAAVAVLLLGIGEGVSSRIHGRFDSAVTKDLDTILTRHFSVPQTASLDLVIAPTGAEHVCNWFFRVKAGVITSLTLSDFDRHRNVYVLNPNPMDLGTETVTGRRAETEADRYWLMRRNIPRPQGAELLFESASVEFFRLEAPPAEWRFAPDGRWNGYR